jgi:N-sulfoglucosamine sulfohydrolase
MKTEHGTLNFGHHTLNLERCGGRASPFNTRGSKFKVQSFLILALFFTCTTFAATPRPNILWLVAEDFGQHLGCYGTKEVSSPHLDKLAREGVRYTRFFTTAPVCSPSRSAFMTGMYQTTIGAHNHRSHRDDGFTLPPGVRVLTDWMRDAGYFTANVRQFPAPIAFKGTGKTDWNFTYTGSSRESKAEGQTPNGPALDLRPSTFDAKPFDTDQWVDLKAHQPFFAQINFQETHRAFKAPKHADPAKVEIPPYYPDHPVTRTDWAEYLDSATELDRKCGVILRKLEQDGLANNTVIVFFGDNGQAHVRGKQFCYESGLLVPMIIRWPKQFPEPKNFKAGTVNTQLLEAIDLAPSMLEIAGARVPTRMQGVPFLGDHARAPKQFVFGARDRCDETVFRFRTVRDGQYRYIRNFTPERPFLQANEYKEKQYPVWNLIKELNTQGKLTPVQAVLAAPTMPKEELYDLNVDPHETNNLALRWDHQPTVLRLRGVLEKWIEESNDQGKELEPAALAASKGVTKTNTNPNAGYTLDGKPPGAANVRPPDQK